MNYSPIEEVALTQKLIRIESTNPGAFEYKVSDFVYDFLAQTGRGCPAPRGEGRPLQHRRHTQG